MAETLIFPTGSLVISGTLVSTASISQLNLDGVSGSFTGTFVGTLPASSLVSSSAQFTGTLDDFEVRDISADDIFTRDDGGIVVGHDVFLSMPDPRSFTGGTPRIVEMQMLGTSQEDSTLAIGCWGNQPPALSFLRSGTGSIGDNAIVANNNTLGIIGWGADDGVNYGTIGAGIQAIVQGTPTASRIPTELRFFVAKGEADNDAVVRFTISPDGRFTFEGPLLIKGVSASITNADSPKFSVLQTGAGGVRAELRANATQSGQVGTFNPGGEKDFELVTDSVVRLTVSGTGPIFVHESASFEAPAQFETAVHVTGAVNLLSTLDVATQIQAGERLRFTGLSSVQTASLFRNVTHGQSLGGASGTLSDFGLFSTPDPATPALRNPTSTRDIHLLNDLVVSGNLLVIGSSSLGPDVNATGSFTGTFIGDFTGSTSFTGSFTGGLEGIAKTAKGFTGTLDAVNTVDEGRWRNFTTVTPTATESVQRTSLGLLFRDQFNRPDSADLGNDWRQDSISQSIFDNKFRHDTGGPGDMAFFTGSSAANRFPTGGLLNVPSKYMVQGNVAMGAIAVGNVHMSAREGVNFQTGSSTFYRAEMFFQGVAARRLTKNLTGSIDFIISNSFAVVSGTFYGERLILEDQGDGTLAVSGAWTLPLSSSFDLAAPFTDEILSTLDSNITASETNIVAITEQVGMFADEFIVQGSEVIVTDLPSGFKARLDSDAAVVESGGSASISVRTRALPFATMSVLNASDTVVAQVFPQSASLSDGWGGDTYAYATATFQEYQLIPVSASGEEEPVALAIRRDGDLVVSGGLGAVSASRFTGTASLADLASSGTGSFTGTFIGDGAGLSPIVGNWIVSGTLETTGSTPAATAFRIPHGVAPTSPVDGDIWTTSAGLFVRINGSTVGPLT